MNQKELVENLKRCPKYEWCNLNLCPLDYELDLRVGRAREKCRYMRRDRKSIMPDELLKFVPKSNISKLNSVSQKRYKEIVV